MEKGKIIFLNGVSSVGKTTLSKMLQLRLTEPYHWLNVDTFIKFTDMNHNPATYFQEGKDPVSLYPHIIKLYSDLGVNVIADASFMKWKGHPTLFLAMETMEKCIEMLHEYPILYVHVTCPLEELSRRHKERGDRGRELNIEQSEYLLVGESHGIYDITVDTFQNTKEECADKIIELLEEPQKHTAFKTLWSQRQDG
ncbi:AAA family ATPase [Clostridium sp. C2-6-12]|uniref:phosphotransferase-like protein n=1 Tax=Clostridium sp. C2-6-12 TaxID=2698832 RepID=UPI0013722866|nr:AAA family ATPase [Clostridium sp. C2-6-12]